MLKPVALTIAGSDSGGGAGIQADLHTFQAFGVWGTTAITAVTAQNPHGVAAIHVVPADMVRAQIDAVINGFPVDAVKSGMLATRDNVAAVAAALSEHQLRNYVLDPVMIATSGAQLLEGGVSFDLLLPLCRLVTPNLNEASALTGIDVSDETTMRAAARVLVDKGARAALVKGGHLPGERVVDVLLDGEAYQVFEHPRIAVATTHGTGCRLSAAIAAGLAQDRLLPDAVARGIAYVTQSLRTSAPTISAG